MPRSLDFWNGKLKTELVLERLTSSFSYCKVAIIWKLPLLIGPHSAVRFVDSLEFEVSSLFPEKEDKWRLVSDEIERVRYDEIGVSLKEVTSD